MTRGDPDPRRAAFQLFSGAGNRFLLVPGDAEARDWSRVARAVCARKTFGESGADGLLVVGPAERADARLSIWNPDGSRPEACGNGLRCAGWWLWRCGRVGPAKIETDCGVRAVEVVESEGPGARVRAEMGRAERFELLAPLPAPAARLRAAGVRVGNPHCVIVVPDERGAPLEEVGAAMQVHPDCPEGVNVGFLAHRGGRWRLRVYERGVGETAACGTGACAAAAVIDPPGGRVVLEMRGGALEVLVRRDGAVELLGDALHHGEVLLELPAARVHGSR